MNYSRSTGCFDDWENTCIFIFEGSIEAKHMKFKINSEKTRGPSRSFPLGKEVLVKSVKGEEIKWIPSSVIKVVSPTTFAVNFKETKKRFVSANHIRETELDFSIRPRPTPSTCTKQVDQSLHVNKSLNNSQVVGLYENVSSTTASPRRPTSPTTASHHDLPHHQQYR